MISQSIGWTLIHSLWQGLIIYVLIRVSFGLIRKSDMRYGIGVIGLSLMVVSAVTTFLLLNKTSASTGFLFVLDAAIVTSDQSVSLLQTILQFIDNNIVWLLRFWLIGFIIGLLRIAGGLLYINTLRRNANPVSEEWTTLVNDLSSSLNITKVIMMAEAAISSPMVIGFVKPMILFPAGLLSGLTTDQVETILLHELSHIRRQDYIINLVQSVIETIFFFNPFALLISALIRDERENCCDDLVIAKGISPITYVKTLAQLEAAKSSSTLALGIAGNQNQLLNRIKRIMENSAKNDWGKGRLVPVALLFLGLICASWITIGSDKKSEIAEPVAIKPPVLALDTIREPYQIIEVPEPPDEIIEVPEAPDPFIETWDEAPNGFAFDFDEMMPAPELELFEYGIFDGGDSIPAYKFRLRDQQAFEEFEKEFKDKMKTQFKDFYNKNQAQFDKMLEEMKQDQAMRRKEAAATVDLDQMARHAEIADAQLALEMAKHNAVIAKQFQFDAMGAEQNAQIAKMGFEQQMAMSRANMDILKEQVDAQRYAVEGMTARFEDYKKALTEQLMRDGYLKSGENIDNLNINENGNEMIINGRKIKEKDRIKYKALEDQYFKPEIKVRYGRSE